MSDFQFTVCLSVNDNYDYYKNMPLVYQAWKSFFPKCLISVGFVNSKFSNKHRLNNQNVTDFLETYSDSLIVVDEIGGIPSENLGKFLRYYVASQQPDGTFCLIHDIDSLPLQTNYWTDYIFVNFIEDKLLAVGHDVYKGTEHEGKFPASNMMGTSNVFAKLLNSDGASFSSIIGQYVGIRMFDDKERLDQTKQNFSDESLIRYMIFKNLRLENVNFLDRKIDIRSQWLDKTFWNLDQLKLRNQGYIECNLPRSFDYNIQSINVTELEKFIKTKYLSNGK